MPEQVQVDIEQTVEDVAVAVNQTVEGVGVAVNQTVEDVGVAVNQTVEDVAVAVNQTVEDVSVEVVENKLVEWQRPEDWLDYDMPTVCTDEEIVGLVAIFPTGTNFVALHVNTDPTANGYEVDWGDGSVETVPVSTKKIHEYDFDSLPASTEIDTAFGTARQVVVRVLPVGGVKFSYINLYISPEYCPSYAVSTWLELSVATEATNISLSYNHYGGAVMGLLEHLRLLHNPDTLTSFGVLDYPRRLRKSTPFNFPNVASLYYKFRGVPLLKPGTVLGKGSVITSMQAAFYASNLADKVDFEVSNSISWSMAFRQAMVKIGQFDIAPPTTVYYMFGAYYGGEIPWFDSSLAADWYGFASAAYCGEVPALDMSAATRATNAFYQMPRCLRIRAFGCRVSVGAGRTRLQQTALEEFLDNLGMPIDGAQTVTLTDSLGVPDLVADGAAIARAEAKGWTVTT